MKTQNTANQDHRRPPPGRKHRPPERPCRGVRLLAVLPVGFMATCAVGPAEHAVSAGPVTQDSQLGDRGRTRPHGRASDSRSRHPRPASALGHAGGGDSWIAMVDRSSAKWLSS